MAQENRPGPDSGAAALPVAGMPLALPGVRFVPGEDVLLLRVELSVMTASQRRAAVGYAVEDRIAEPLEQVRVVLGPDLGAGTQNDGAGYLVAVVSGSVLQALAAGQDRRHPLRLLPDVLALPRPGPGDWSVWAASERVLVRQADGTGFACDTETLATYWQAAGFPAVTLFGGTLPDGIAVAGHAVLPGHLDPALARFDLAARPAAVLPRGAGACSAVLAAAAVLHLAVLLADVSALGRTADARAAALSRALTEAGQPAGRDPDQALAAVLAARLPAEPGGFLPLLAEGMAALAPLSGQVSLQDLAYDQASGGLHLTLEAPDLATLQGAETLLTAAGIAVEAGAAVNGDGAAEVEMTLLRGGRS